MTKEKDAEPGCLIAGYLDVKLPARSRRRRFGGPWKSWRRHWVEARAARDESVAVELVLSAARLSPETAVILVRLPSGPAGAGVSSVSPGVCRTASRSRGHAFVIATSTATAGSEASQLGALGALGGEVFLAARSEAETERWMAVLRSALAAHATAIAPTPCMPFPTPRLGGLLGAASTSAALLRGRRLSRSEGDLLLAGPLSDLATGLATSSRACAACGGCGPEAGEAGGGGSSSGTLGRTSQTRQPFRLLYGRRRAETLRSDATDRLSTSPQSTSSSALSLFGGKIASGLLSAGLGLILSTPGGSETEDNDAEQDEENDEVGDVTSVAAALTLDRRRESAVSVASGIYEEIADSIDMPTRAGMPSVSVVIERVYENAGPAGTGPRRASSLYEDPALLVAAGAAGGPGQGTEDSESAEGPGALPPPLPPRRNLTPISELLTRTVGCDDGGVDSNGYVQMGRVRMPTALQSFRKCHSPTQTRNDIETEPAYLPMSPIRPLVLDNRKSSS